MPSYVVVYRGGRALESDEQRTAVMAAWGRWYTGLGGAVADAGNPFGPSRAVAPDGTVTDGGPSGLTGYSILKADDLPRATALTKGCPHLTAGGSIEVYEVSPIM